MITDSLRLIAWTGLLGITVLTQPVIADIGHCDDVTSPACPARDFYPRADRLTAAGQDAYYFVSNERPPRVAFVTRATYSKFGPGQVAPAGLIWRERRP